MLNIAEQTDFQEQFPDWVPEAPRRYLLHTEAGLSIRELARDEGCHASTILRQVRRVEARRDDPLFDEALEHLVTTILPASNASLSDLGPKEPDKMVDMPRNFPKKPSPTPDEATIEREARRILRRLSESRAMLVLADNLERAAVLREMPDGRSTRTAVVDRAVAQAFAIKDWIQCKGSTGKVTTYHITSAGRSALKRLLSKDRASCEGFDEAQAQFGDQHRDWGEKDVSEVDQPPKKVRYNVSESPLAILALALAIWCCAYVVFLKG